MAIALVWLAYHYSGAHLSVESDPAGALVRLNGAAIGQTPLRRLIEPDHYLLVVELPQFEHYRETLDAHRGEQIDRKVTLIAGEGTLQLLSNPRGAWVEVDGKRLDTQTPTTLIAASGERRVRMGLPERRPMERVVQLDVGAVLEVSMDLEIEPYGSLIVTTSPADARVSLPESDVPYERGVRLPIGEYLIRVARDGYASQDIRFRVRYGDNLTHLALQRAHGRLRITTTPPTAEVSVSYRDDRGVERRVDYTSDLQVPVGRVELRASLMGYRSAYRHLNLTEGTQSVRLALSPIDVKAGDSIEDPLGISGQAPRMVVLPAGEFLMGDDNGPPSQKPARTVRLTEPFAISATEVSVRDYLRFVSATGHKADPRLTGIDGDEPARHLSWDDARAYADWLSEQTGARYRLPSEAEWEYAARAGGKGAYSFGEDEASLCLYANLADRSTRRVFRDWQVADCDDGFARLASVGKLQPNAFGLFDMHGNVSEWVLECGMPDYADAPVDGRPVDDGRGCQSHGFRGGTWDDPAEALRVYQRGASSSPGDDRGIRLLREL